MAVCAVFAAVLRAGAMLMVGCVRLLSIGDCVGRVQVTVGRLGRWICDLGHVCRKSRLGVRVRILNNGQLL